MKSDDKSNRFEYPNPRESVNLLYIAAKGMAACVWPFIRSHPGVHALGAPGVIALLIILLYAAGQNAPEMMTYLVVWFLVVAFRNAQARRQERRGRGEHSRYDGWPWLAMRLPFVRDEVKAKGVEPFVCFAIGVFICPLSEPMGKFVMLGAVGLLLVRVMELRANEVRARRMRDAMIEMRQLSEDLRRMR